MDQTIKSNKSLSVCPRTSEAQLQSQDMEKILHSNFGPALILIVIILFFLFIFGLKAYVEIRRKGRFQSQNCDGIKENAESSEPSHQTPHPQYQITPKSNGFLRNSSSQDTQNIQINKDMNILRINVEDLGSRMTLYEYQLTPATFIDFGIHSFARRTM